MKQKTMEDALETYPNRFQLTMMAVARAKEINDGDPPLEPVEGNVKPVVLALREIAEGRVVPSSREEMSKFREARRLLRERALLKAEEEDLLEGEGGEDTFASARPDEDPLES